MLVLKQTERFKADLKAAARKGKDIDDIEHVIELLQAGHEPDETYCDHSLTGNWKGHRECHIEPDWLLIYRMNGNELILVRTGTHKDLFG